VLGAIAGGWTVNGLFTRFSGTPFTVNDSAASCNCPGNSQTADQVKPNVALLGNGVGPTPTSYTPYFDPTAYAPVVGARFGTSGFNRLRGPGAANLDFGIFRNFPITERIKLQIRAESLNLTNTPHFANPTSANLNVSNYRSAANPNGFGQITGTQQLSRLLDQRYFRFGLRIIF
jgi:hypothetical protein